MKVGDKVTSSKYPGRVFELAWYQEVDATCAIQDKKAADKFELILTTQTE